MKKLFIIFFSMFLLFIGCTKIEDTYIKNSQTNKNEIVFTTNTATKAIVDGTDMVDHFGVYGWVVPGTYSENGGYLMKNGEYLPDGTTANGVSYYWPISDNTEVDFLFTAYSQFASPEFNDETGEITITIPEISQELIESEDFNDVLYAQTLVHNHQSALAEHESIELTFNHVLSWVQFRAEVANNTSIQWVKIDSVKFEQYQEGQPAVEYQPEVPEVPYQPAVYDTTDFWVNLKRSYSAVGSSTKLRVKTGDIWGSYTNAAPLPEALVAEIKSYYSINNGDPGNYDLHMGNSVWPSNEVRQLRVVKAIPEEYKVTISLYNSEETMDVFDGWKYLQDNGYDIQPATSGGKPAVWDYVLIDAFVNGQAYTVVGFNPWDSNSTANYTIEEVSPEVPYQEGHPEVPAQDAIPEGYIKNGIYVGGTLTLPTKTTISESPNVVYDTTGEKAMDLNYISQVWTIYGPSIDNIHNTILGNALVVPQAVPEYITVVFDICIKNNTGDEVIITDRKITRKINTGKDNLQVDYTASWLASNKYIYNFKFDGDLIDFTVNTTNWSNNNTNYHVWDY